MGLLPLYFQQVRANTPAHTGVLMIPMGVGMALALVIAGKIARRVELRSIALVGVLAVAAGVGIFTQVGASTNGFLLGVGQALIGAGVGAIIVSTMTAAMAELSQNAIPKASTSVRIVQGFGTALGSAMILIVLQTEINNHFRRGDLESLAGAYGTTFWWVLGAAALTLVPVLLIPAGLIRDRK